MPVQQVKRFMSLVLDGRVFRNIAALAFGAWTGIVDG